MTNIQPISPMLSKMTLIQPSVPSNPVQKQAEVAKPIFQYSPLLSQTLLAQNKQILAPQALSSVNITEAQRRVPAYKNQLKGRRGVSLFRSGNV